MLYNLPQVKKLLKTIKINLLQIKQNPTDFFRYFIHSLQLYFQKRGKYLLAAFLDIACLAIILVNAPKPAARIWSLINPWKETSMYTQINYTTENFSFIPGQSHNKYDDIDFNGLNTLAFFDLPVTEEGINYQSRGYNSFTSQKTLNLVSKAHSYNTKVLVTVSQTDDSTISQILSDTSIQNLIIDQIIQEVQSLQIEGVAVDFEPTSLSSDNYQKNYVSFISELSSRLHQEVPNSTVATVIPSTASKKAGFFDLSNLSNVSDKLFIVAQDIIVPETKNASLSKPTYGYDEKSYWADLSKSISSFTNQVKKEKLVMERAWYGNGSQYPLYIPSSTPIQETSVIPQPVNLDQESIQKLAAGVPQKGRAAAIKNIPLIAKALEEEGILDSNVLAYALATIEHETDQTFEPISEIQGKLSARRLGYEGGANFYGRGFIQLTHLRNYQKFGERLGLGQKLAQNPELASDPYIAAKVLAAFFKDNNVANLASQGYFVQARTPINPDYNGWTVATLAYKYEE